MIPQLLKKRHRLNNFGQMKTRNLNLKRHLRCKMSIRIMCEAASRSLDFPYCFIKRSIIDSDFLEAFRCREISDLQKD